MQDTLAFVGMFAGNFAPRGYELCNGQLISIAQNTALFAVIGTIYGGDGQSTFGLPDLRGRIAVGTGQGPGLSSYVEGETGGTETITLTANNIGNHSHGLTGTAGILVSSQDGHTPVASNNFPAVNGDNIYASTTDNSLMAPASLSLTTNPAGTAAQPVDNTKPYLAINFVIAVEGIFPSRN
jgi:microcystin-dependent protein